MKNIKSKLKYYLRELIKDFSTLDHNDYEREEELEIRFSEIVEVMLNNKIIDDENKTYNIVIGNGYGSTISIKQSSG